MLRVDLGGIASQIVKSLEWLGAAGFRDHSRDPTAERHRCRTGCCRPSSLEVGHSIVGTTML